MIIINTIPHGKFFVWYLRSLFCSRNLTLWLRKLVRFLIRLIHSGTPKVAGVMSPALTTYKSTWQDKQLRATIGQVKRPKKHSSDLLKAKWIDRQRTWSTPTTMMAPYRMKQKGQAATRRGTAQKVFYIYWLTPKFIFAFWGFTCQKPYGTRFKGTPWKTLQSKKDCPPLEEQLGSYSFCVMWAKTLLTV